MSLTNVRSLESRFAEYSVESFKIFTDDLNEALAKSVPTNPSRYEHAAVLAITWSNDDIGVEQKTDQLLWILRNVYNYETEHYVLDATCSKSKLRRDLSARIKSFTSTHESKTDEKDHLLVYYYSGHAYLGLEYLLSGRLQTSGLLAEPCLNWYDFDEGALKVPKADTLVIFDSGYPPTARAKAPGEILAATGWETITPTSPYQSFTKFLIEEFVKANGRAFTASQLHSRLMGTAFLRNTKATPVHVARPDGKPSVVFHRIPTKKDTREVQLRPQELNGKVVIRVGVRDDVPNADEWANWLSANMPPDLREIEILTKYQSGTSVCVLVAVPVVLWNYLPDRNAYGYVSRYWGRCDLDSDTEKETEWEVLY